MVRLPVMFNRYTDGMTIARGTVEWKGKQPGGIAPRLGKGRLT